MQPSFGKTYELQPVPPEVKSFLDAAKAGDLATVRTLLDQGVSVKLENAAAMIELLEK